MKKSSNNLALSVLVFWGILALASTPLTAEVLDKMAPVNDMMAGMLMTALISGVVIFLAFRFRVWLGVMTLFLLALLNYRLPDHDPFVRTAVLHEAGRMFAVVYYGRWLLLLAGCGGGLRRLWRRNS